MKSIELYEAEALHLVYGLSRRPKIWAMFSYSILHMRKETADLKEDDLKRPDFDFDTEYRTLV